MTPLLWLSPAVFKSYRPVMTLALLWASAFAVVFFIVLIVLLGRCPNCGTLASSYSLWRAMGSCRHCHKARKMR